MAAKPTDRSTAVAARICEARDAAGLNNSSLARATGLDRRQIVRLTGGKNEPSQETLERIASATGRPLDFFRASAAEAQMNERVVEAASALVSVLMEAAVAAASDAKKRPKVAA